MLKLVVGVLLSLVSTTSMFGDNSIDVPFEMVNGLIIIEADIDGNVDNYILDSGSNGVLLNAQGGVSSVSYQSLDGEVSGEEKRIEKLKVGEFVSEELLGFVTDLSDLEAYVGRSVGGILGYAVFTPKSLVFDFASGQITISDAFLDDSSIENMRTLSFVMVQDLPIVEVMIGDQRAQFILDTGASAHFIDYKMLDKYAYTTTGVEKSILTASGSTNMSSQYQTTGTNIDSDDGHAYFYAKDFDLLSEELGMEVSGLVSLSRLSQDRVYFDLKRQKLFY